MPPFYFWFKNMKKKKNKLISILLTICLLFTLFPLQVMATSEQDSEIEIVLTTADGKNYKNFEPTKTENQKITYNDNEVDIDVLFIVNIPSKDQFSSLSINSSLTEVETWYREYISGGAYYYPSGTTINTGRSLNNTINNQKISVSGKTDDSTLSYFLVTSQLTKDTKTSKYAILFRVGAASLGDPVSIDKAELTKKIEASSNYNEGYYTSEDRYNGKETSTSGFWADFQSALTTANSVNDNEAATQKQVDAAVDALQSAMDNLISTDNVNPTNLYEAIQAAKYDQKDSADYTESTWKVFDSAYQAASDELAKLYDTDGKPTDYNITTTGDLQKSIDSLADELTAAASALETVSQSKEYQRRFNLGRTYLKPMIQLAESAEQSEYTEESWQTLQTALDAAKNVYAETTELPSVKEEKTTAINAYRTAYQNLFQAYYYTLTPTDSIKVKLTATDPIAVRPGQNQKGEGEYNYSKNGATETANGISGYIGEITLDNDYTLGAALKKAGISPRSSDYPKVYINGVFVSEKYVSDGTEIDTASMLDNIKLHPEDEVVVAWNYYPWSLQSPSIAGLQAYFSQYVESLKTASFTEGDSITVEAGEKFSLHVQEYAAYLGADTASASAADGMHLYISESAENGTENQAGSNLIKEGSQAVTTDETGTATFALYSPGWYVVSAYDLSDDILGDMPDWPATAEMSSGVYASVNSGAVIRVHVTESTNLTQVKKNLQEELQQTYKDYPESYFSEDNWKEIQEAYDTAKAAIEDAGDTSGARLAQQTGIARIQIIQTATTAANEANLKNLHIWLDQLPDDTSLLDQSMKTKINELVAAYGALSDYQVGLLTTVEKEKCEAICAAAEDINGLPQAINYKLNVNVKTEGGEDQAALEAMIAWLQKNNPVKYPQASGTDIDDDEYKNASDMYKLYQFTTNSGIDTKEITALSYVTLPVDVGYFSYPLIRGTGELSNTEGTWKITDEDFQLTKTDYLNYTVAQNFTVTLNGSEYEIKSITYDGIDKSNVKLNPGSFIDKTDYNGKDPSVVNVNFKEALVYFQMPYNDVTVTVTWGKVDLESQKTAAIQAIEEAYNGYSLTDYDEAGQAALENAMKAGIDNVNAATTEDGIAAARKAALAAMAAVAKKGSSSSEEQTGTAVGRVHVSVENTTYSGAPSALRGRFLDTYVTLYDNDTMMTCILRALKDNGFSWTGTGGSTSNGKDDTAITYLASIIKGSDGLAQFDGGSQSGWMGTLNDFFVNEGFQSFGVQSTGFYKLENGDEISVMYTSQGLGEDIGGSWGNSDTSLKALSVSGGTLSPAFDGKTLEYTLIIPGDTANVVVTPTAANKNYLVRTYLNSYKKESAFYKRAESIPVKNGDVIYVGIGEPEWPSMNKQGAEARDYTATKYTIKVVKAGADSVNEAIQALPSEDKITYANYKNYVSAVTSAKEMYDALTSSDKAEVNAEDTAKLNAAVEKIQFYADIDNVKALLAALPNSDKVADSQLSGYRSQINAATAAYTKLNDEQKKYITINDVDNYNKLAERLGMTSITGSEEMPESDVATANGITTAPTQVAVSGDTATATVKADTMVEILKQASENKSKVIELQVTDGDVKDATKVALELSKTSASNIAAKTDASLQVTTPLGSVTMDQTALNEAIKAASGSDLTIVLEKQTVAEADKDLLGSDAAQTKVSILSGGKEITDLSTGKVTISLPVTSDLKDKELGVVYTDSEGKLVKVSGKLVTINGKQYYQIETSKPETFTLAEAAKIDAAIKAQGGETDEEKAERIKAGVQAITIKLRSTFSKKNNIQLNWTKSKGYKVDYYEVFKSTKRYSGFGTKAYYKTSTGTKNFYINTKELKKGTRYFYKVRGVRVINGEKVYTQWSNKAWRISRVNRK